MNTQPVIINDYFLQDNFEPDNREYVENNAYIIKDNIQNKNILTIFFNNNNYEYFKKINKKYNGLIKTCCVQKEKKLYTYILEIYDIYILEFLSELYNNSIKPNQTNTYLYLDYLDLYNNQLSVSSNDNNLIFI